MVWPSEASVLKFGMQVAMESNLSNVGAEWKLTTQERILGSLRVQWDLAYY